MAIQVRKGSGAVQPALVASYNALRGDMATAASKYHADVTSGASTGDFTAKSASALLVSSATATDLASSIALANEVKAKCNVHFADAIAHKAADTANVISTADATDLASVQTLLNAVKTKFNAHLTQAGVHYTNDATNTVATANATDQTTSNALANALKTAYNAHIQGAPSGSSIVLVSP